MYGNNNYMYGVPQIQTPQPQQNNDGIVWVQGESGAKSFLVAPNRTVLLMDSESQKFYIKTSDASGMPLPLRVFDYTEVLEHKADNAEYVTRDEYQTLMGKIEDLEKSIRKPVRAKKEEEDG